MIDEPKKEEQAPEAQAPEINGQDLDQVAGGRAIVSDPDEGGDYTDSNPKKNVVPKTNAAFPR